jgi:hypothetical protein
MREIRDLVRSAEDFGPSVVDKEAFVSARVVLCIST